MQPTFCGAPQFNELAYSAALNLAVGVGSNGTLATSADGVTWTSRAVAGSYQGINGGGVNYNTVVWAAAKGMFVVGGAFGRVATSTDGIAWTERSTGTDAVIQQVCFNAALGVYCAVGEQGYIGTSTDGITWVTRIGAFRSVVIWSVASLEAKGFVAFVGTSGMAQSPDGVTWAATMLPANVATTAANTTGKAYYSATWGGVLVPGGNAAAFAFTNDGLTLTLGQGVSSSATAYSATVYDPYTDCLLCAGAGGCSVMPTAYNRTTQFIVPTIANTWIRAT